MKVNAAKVLSAAQENTNDAENVLYNGPQLSVPISSPTKTDASIRAILLLPTKENPNN